MGFRGFALAGYASNGEKAVEQVKALQPDLVVTDLEMPVMDGLTAIPLMRAAKPNLKIIVCSALTDKGARISLDALARGAHDYILKPTSVGNSNTNFLEQFKEDFYHKIKWLMGLSKPIVDHKFMDKPDTKLSISNQEPSNTTISHKPVVAPLTPDPLVKPGLMTERQAAPLAKPFIRTRTLTPLIKAIAVGSSTGGPAALQTMLKPFTKLVVPMFITQHMPKLFTAVMAEHIRNNTGLDCVEAEDYMAVKAGRIHIAPGGMHMVVHGSVESQMIRTNEDPPENFCRPSVEPMLRSLISIYKQNLLVIILTGMGNDGSIACELAQREGAIIIAQNEETSTVWGMPGAVVRKGLAEVELAPADIFNWISRNCLLASHVG